MIKVLIKHPGCEIIRFIAEIKDRCKYPLWGRD